MTKTELYDFILNNKKAYHRILKSSNNELYTIVKEKYADVKNIGESFWLYCNDYAEPLKCVCGKKLLFGNVVSGYKSAKCKDCYSTNRENNSITNLLLQEQNNKDLPICENFGCNNKVILKKDGTWSKVCSAKCKGKYNSKKSRETAKNTWLSKYGVDHHRKDEKSIEKFNNSVLEKYNVYNIMDIPGVLSKRNNTNLSIYGSECVLSNKEIKLKIAETNIKKYGVVNPSQNIDVHTKKMKSLFLAKDYALPSGVSIKIQGYENIFLDSALKYYDEHLFNFSKQVSIDYIYNSKQRKYFPDFLLNNQEVIEVKSRYTFFADLEKNVAKMEGVLSAGLIHNFVIYENNTPNVLCFSKLKNSISNCLTDNNIDYIEIAEMGKYIVDYYIESARLVLVYRNINLTNDVFVDKNYYFDMHNYFNSIGIQLVIVNNTELSPTWLKSFITKIKKPTERIYARDTSIKEIGKGEIVKFLTNNHIQGFAQTSIKYGLYYNNNLIAVMCFNKFRNGTGKNRGQDSYELVRYATSINVMGGAGKLLNYFINRHRPKIIYSYSDNSISSGLMYKKLNFVLEHNNKPDYKYYIYGNNKLLHRFGFRKGALSSKLSNYDCNLSEYDNMLENGFRRLYDSGKKTWVLYV